LAKQQDNPGQYVINQVHGGCNALVSGHSSEEASRAEVPFSPLAPMSYTVHSMPMMGTMLG
jgi:hypothetical protein